MFDTFNLRAEIRRFKILKMFDLRVGGRTEHQKYPAMLIILCEYIDKVYTYLYMK